MAWLETGMEWSRQLLDEHRLLISVVAGVSVTMMVLCMLALPWVVLRLQPETLRDYVNRPPDRPAKWRHTKPMAYWTVRVLKNVAGVILAVAGVAMLVLPGQGVLTLILAMVLLDLPGKQKLERRLLSDPRVVQSINRLRRWRNKPPVLAP